MTFQFNKQQAAPANVPAPQAQAPSNRPAAPTTASGLAEALRQGAGALADKFDALEARPQMQKSASDVRGDYIERIEVLKFITTAAYGNKKSESKIILERTVIASAPDPTNPSAAAPLPPGVKVATWFTLSQVRDLADLKLAISRILGLPVNMVALVPPVFEAPRMEPGEAPMAYAERVAAAQAEHASVLAEFEASGREAISNMAVPEQPLAGTLLVTETRWRPPSAQAKALAVAENRPEPKGWTSPNFIRSITSAEFMSLVEGGVVSADVLGRFFNGQPPVDPAWLQAREASRAAQ